MSQYSHASEGSVRARKIQIAGSPNDAGAFSRNALRTLLISGFTTCLEGRLNGAALNLLEGADIQFRRENRLDIALVKNLPIALIFLPAADIPTFVGQGRVDLGITGWDQVEEHNAIVRSSAYQRGEEFKTGGCDMVMNLGFGGCKLQVQVPEKGKYASGDDLIGRVIGTSFIGLAADYFAKLEAKAAGEPNADKATAGSRKLKTQIIELSGSVEAACALGVADGIVDLVGESLPLDPPTNLDAPCKDADMGG